MFSSLVRRAAVRPGAPPPQPPNVLPVNPYKTKKVWPPDFSKLSPQEQLRFEKRYKRRVGLASARPEWNKMVKLAQFFSISFVIAYSVLFMDWGNETHAFDSVREKFWGAFGAAPSEQPDRGGNGKPEFLRNPYK